MGGGGSRTHGEEKAYNQSNLPHKQEAITLGEANLRVDTADKTTTAVTATAREGFRMEVVEKVTSFEPE